METTIRPGMQVKVCNTWYTVLPQRYAITTNPDAITVATPSGHLSYVFHYEVVGVRDGFTSLPYGTVIRRNRSITNGLLSMLPEQTTITGRCFDNGNELRYRTKDGFGVWPWFIASVVDEPKPTTVSEPESQTTWVQDCIALACKHRLMIFIQYKKPNDDSPIWRRVSPLSIQGDLFKAADEYNDGTPKSFRFDRVLNAAL